MSNKRFFVKLGEFMIEPLLDYAALSAMISRMD